jgi:hypothetical protein
MDITPLEEDDNDDDIGICPQLNIGLTKNVKYL